MIGLGSRIYIKHLVQVTHATRLTKLWQLQNVYHYTDLWLYQIIRDVKSCSNVKIQFLLPFQRENIELNEPQSFLRFTRDVKRKISSKYCTRRLIVRHRFWFFQIAILVKSMLAMGLLNESLRLLCGGLPFRRRRFLWWRRFLPGFFLTIQVKHNTANYRADAENDCWNALVDVSAIR